MLTPQQVGQKWQTNTANAGQAFTNGVNAVTQSPMAAAAANLQAYLTGVQNAVTSGKMAAKLNAVTLDSWKQSMLTKGATRISGGVAAAVPKVVAFMTTWLPLQQTLRDRVRQMPRGSVADSQARSNFSIAYNAAYSKRLVGS